MTYDNIHRYFLRTMANRGVLSMSESLKVLQKFTGLVKSETDILNLVKEINKEISFLKQRIQIVNDNNTEICEKSLIFMNLVADMATKAQNIFKEKECQYFMKLIVDIIKSESRQLIYKEVMKDMINFLRLKREERKEAVVLIDRWCKLSYLKKIPNAVVESGKENADVYITLGLRGIYEFETYFTENLKDLVECCPICKKIVIMGCHCQICGNALHKQCLDTHMENKHINDTTIDDISTEDQLDNSSISTDKEEDLLNSESDNEVVPMKRMRIISTDSDEEIL